MSQSQTLCESPAPEDELATELTRLEAEEVAIEEQECLKREREAVEQELRQVERERQKEEMWKEMRHREEEKKMREEAEWKAEEERKRKEQEEWEWKEQEEQEKKEWEEAERKEQEEMERKKKEETEKQKKQEEESSKKQKDKGKEKEMEKASSLGALSPLKKKQKIFVGMGMARSSWSAQESEVIEIEESDKEPGLWKKMGGKNPCWKCRNTGYACKPHPMKSRNACIQCTQMHGRCLQHRPPLPKWEGVSGPAGNGMTQEQGAELLQVMQALAHLNMQVMEGIKRLVELMERLDRWQEAAVRALERPEDRAEEIRAQ